LNSSDFEQPRAVLIIHRFKAIVLPFYFELDKA